MATAQQVPQILNDFDTNHTTNKLFFKALANFHLKTSESDVSSIKELKYSNNSLACSNKYGCLFVALKEEFLMIRLQDIISFKESKGPIDLTQLPHFKIPDQGNYIGSLPKIIVLSANDEFIAFDTIKNGSSFVLIYKLEEFLNKAGSCEPFVELRISQSYVLDISWNPGENKNKIAVCSSEGGLLLAEVKGPKLFETWSLNNSNITSFCWSPKGKQIIVGTANGALIQLKLDLSPAKMVPGPQSNYVPKRIHWISTSQFLIYFQVLYEQQSSIINVMTLDIVKGTPPIYRNYGDVFISDEIPEVTSGYFLALNEWNTILAASNTSSEVALFEKVESNWKTCDISEDSYRAALPLDNYTCGAAFYLGNDEFVKFSETEVYNPMPILFLLSQTQMLSAFYYINNDVQAHSVVRKSDLSIAPNIFTKKASLSNSGSSNLKITQISSLQPQQPLPPQQQQQSQQLPPPTIPVQPQKRDEIPQTLQNQPQFHDSMAPLKLPQEGFFSELNLFSQQPQPNQLMFQSQPQPSQPQPPPQPSHQQQQQFQIKEPSSGGQSFTEPLYFPNLPSTGEIQGAKKLIEDKISSISQTNEKSRSQEEDEVKYKILMLELETFEAKFSRFKLAQKEYSAKIEKRLNHMFNIFENQIILELHEMENFMHEVIKMTESQSGEIGILKKKLTENFGTVLKIKSIVEKSRTPEYLELKKSQPLDLQTQQKIQKIAARFKNIKSQVVEIERYIDYSKKMNQNPSVTYRQESKRSLYYIQQSLKAHSVIITRLKEDIDNLKGQVEHLPKYSKEKESREKEMFKVYESIQEDKDSKKQEQTYDELTKGINNVSLGQGQDFMSADKHLKKLKELCTNIGDMKLKPGPEGNLNKKDSLEKAKQEIQELKDFMKPKPNKSIETTTKESKIAPITTPPSFTSNKTVTVPVGDENDTPLIKSLLTSKICSPSTIASIPTNVANNDGLFKSPPLLGFVPSPLSLTTKEPTKISFEPPKTVSPLLSAALKPDSSSTTTITTNASLFGTPPSSRNFASITTTTTASEPGVGLFGSLTITTTAASSPSIFGSSAVSTTAPSLFGPSSAISSTPSLFGSSAATTTTPSLFSSPAATITAITPNLFGSPAATTTATAPSLLATITTTTSPSLFGSQATSTVPNVFGSPTTATITPSLFGSPPPPVNATTSTTTTGTSFFGSPVSSTTSPNAGTGLFGSPLSLPATSSSTNLFGSPAPSSTTTTGLGLFGSPSSAPSAAPGVGLFGSLTITTTAASSPSIFGAPATSIPSLFGSPAVTTTTPSLFGSPATSTVPNVFGSSTTATLAPSLFGSPSSNATTASGTSFFGSPISSTTAPNVGTGLFGSPLSLPATSSSTNLFGSPSSTTTGLGLFGSPSAPLSAATTGQQGLFGSPSTNQQQQPGGFNKPALGGFGSQPVFGSSAAFGGAPAFGKTSVFGSSFSSPAPIQQQPGTVFGDKTSIFGGGGGNVGGMSGGGDGGGGLSFGNLATQQTPPSFFGFGQQQQQPQQQQLQQVPQMQQQQPQMQQAQQQQPPPAFGGNSFSSWR